MDASKEKAVKLQIAKTMENLKKNNMDAYFVKTKGEVIDKVTELLHDGDTVAVGGSETLKETGVLSLLRSGRYHFLDRYAPGLSGEETRKLFLESFAADAYLCSSNAITMNGELYNVDGNSNRVAAICYGPTSVIIVAGYNKIVPDLDGAVRHVKQFAAPDNAIRLNCQTYCASAGVCKGLSGEEMTVGCQSSARICCNYVISAHQRVPGRIKVLLVGESLGY